MCVCHVRESTYLYKITAELVRFNMYECTMDQVLWRANDVTRGGLAAE